MRGKSISPLFPIAGVERFPTDMGSEIQRNDSHMFFFTGLRRRI